jgi:hypothetical protein
MRIDFRFSSMPQRAIWYAGGVQYVAFCILLLLSDSLLGVSGFHHLRMIVANAADVLLFAFPNCLFSLMFGITDIWIGALALTGVANGLFFWRMGLWITRTQTSNPWLRACVGYVLLSLIVYVAANCAFFSYYFMRAPS